MFTELTLYLIGLLEEEGPVEPVFWKAFSCDLSPNCDSHISGP